MQNMITEIQSLGVRVHKEILGRKGGAGPAEGRAFLINNTPVTVPIAGHYVQNSPFSLESSDSGYLLLKNNKPQTTIQVVREPRFYKKRTNDGINFKTIALLHGKDCLATTVFQRCVHWKHSKRCGFCATETSVNAGTTLEKKSPAQLAQVTRAAWELDGISHVVLTSGTGDPPGSEIPYLAKCVRAIKAAVDIPIQVQFAPPENLSAMVELQEAGTDAVGIHVETFDPEIFKIMAPAKAEIGMERYERAWKMAVDLFGPNQVSSFLIAGMGETQDSLAWGSEYLADLGVYPFVVPLRPIPGSRLQNRTPPNPDNMKRIYHAVAKILQKKGLATPDTKAGCVKCGACSALSLFEEKKDAPLICHTTRTTMEKEEAFRIRQNIFVKEQQMFAHSDQDDKDQDGIHLVAKKENTIIGTVRVFRGPSGNGHWIGGRLAVKKEARATRAGSMLVKEAMKRVKKKGCTYFTAEIQEKNIPFFLKLGWKPIGEVKEHFGCPHLSMEADLNNVPGDF